MKIDIQHVDRLRYLATSGAHSLVIDMSHELGGVDTALGADQVFGAALGACALNFVANSCRLHSIPTDGLRAVVELERVERPRRLSGITLRLALGAALSQEQRDTLIGVAQHCILANTLARPPQITVLFEEEDALGA
jgi:uncharacterized OsmC-like protein